MNTTIYALFDRIEEGKPARCWLVATNEYYFEDETLLPSLGVETTELFGREIITFVPKEAISVPPQIAMFGATDCIPRELGSVPCAVRFEPLRRYEACQERKITNNFILKMTNTSISYVRKAQAVLGRTIKPGHLMAQTLSKPVTLSLAPLS